MEVAERVVDANATAGVDALPFSRWLRDQVSYAAKRAVPALRDTLVATLTPFSGTRVGDGYGPDLPHVTVVVVGDDPDRALRTVGSLEEQTYPKRARRRAVRGAECGRGERGRTRGAR